MTKNFYWCCEWVKNKKVNMSSNRCQNSQFFLNFLYASLFHITLHWGWKSVSFTKLYNLFLVIDYQFFHILVIPKNWNQEDDMFLKMLFTHQDEEGFTSCGIFWFSKWNTEGSEYPFLLNFFALLGIDFRTSWLLDQCSTPEHYDW
jgi:hypothetical protein